MNDEEGDRNAFDTVVSSPPFQYSILFFVLFGALIAGLQVHIINLNAVTASGVHFFSSMII